uniref:Uncharacterized protein n=1 Tax=Romanomermis culicivorax TaxID=13658 RepID=A0A915HUN3_ROMCU
MFEIEVRTANMIIQMIRDNVKQPHNNLAQMVIARYQGLSKICSDAVANIRALAQNEESTTLIDVFRRSALEEWNKFRPLEVYLEFAGYSGFSNYFMNLTFTKHPKNELNELFPMTKVHMRTTWSYEDLEISHCIVQRLIQRAVANEVNGKQKGPILKSLKHYFDLARQFVETPLMTAKSK